MLVTVLPSLEIFPKLFLFQISSKGAFPLASQLINAQEGIISISERSSQFKAVNGFLFLYMHEF